MLLKHISNEAALKRMYFEALYFSPFMYACMYVCNENAGQNFIRNNLPFCTSSRQYW